MKNTEEKKKKNTSMDKTEKIPPLFFFSEKHRNVRHNSGSFGIHRNPFVLVFLLVCRFVFIEQIKR